MQATIDTVVKNDSNKFFTYPDFQSGMSKDISVGSYLVPGISNLMAARVIYLQSQPEFTAKPPTISDVNSQCSPSCDSAFISVKVENSKLVYIGSRLSIDKKFAKVKMYDDGKHRDGMAADSVYGVTVEIDPANSQFYIYAENDHAGIFSPERAEHTYYAFSQTLKINSVIFKNSVTVYPNPASDRLYFNNKGSVEIKKIVVQDLLGQEKLAIEKSDLDSVDVSQLEAGVYVICLVNARNEMARIKISILKK
jgi:hypothetical protein